MAFSLGSFVVRCTPPSFRSLLLSLVAQGPIVGGQIIAAVQIKTGWMIIAILAAALSALSLPAVVIFVGGPLRGKKKIEGGVEA
jgi:hypothetical protein